MIASHPPYRERRERLLATLAAEGGGVAILPTAPERIRNRDTHYPYRADSYVLYLSGFAEPESVIVLCTARGTQPARQILFCRSKDAEREIWDGFRYGPEAACSTFAFDEAWPIDELDDRLPGLLADQPALYYALGADSEWDARITCGLNAVRAQTRSGQRPPERIVDVRRALDEMRLFKDDYELSIMRRAAAVTADAHHRAMRAVRPGRYEYALEAELLHAFRQGGSPFPAYPSIVAGGAHACVLHYVANDAPLRDGDLVLIDAGCELDGYACDITRTFPVNGRFTTAQRAVYDIVLAAQQAALDAVCPGNEWDAPHAAAVRVLSQGLLDLGLLTGTLDEVIAEERYRRFYMHRTGHWLGLDVHDVGDYKEDGEWRLLEAGMVLTIEPGLYIRAADDIPAEYHDIGIRIEDDVLVTPDGYEVLTAACLKDPDAIETLITAPH